jgi:hypothetical protein
MIIGILQPGYLPWLGFFEQMYRSDIFVLYDDVQYDKEGWRNRNRIKSVNGVQWLTVPVLVKFSDRPLINDIRINNEVNWRKKHLTSIKQNYRKAPFFKDYCELFEEAYSREWEFLVDLDVHLIMKLAECLGMEGKKIIRSSALLVQGERIERLVRLCKYLRADTFYEGAAGRNYIDEGAFLKEGVRVEFQDYQHPNYPQLYGEFVPNLSVIDLLFNHGRESLSILTNQKKGRSTHP